VGTLASNPYLGVPIELEDEVEHRRRIAGAVNNTMQGKTLNYGAASLAANSVSTTVSDARCGPNSVIHIAATSAAAAKSLATWWISTRTKGSFTVAHVTTTTSAVPVIYTIHA